MTIYIVDWGENCNGARYALVSARNPLNLMFTIDSIGDPSGCKFCDLRECMFFSEDYLELGTTKECYSHSLESALKEITWKNIEDIA